MPRTSAHCRKLNRLGRAWLPFLAALIASGLTVQLRAADEPAAIPAEKSSSETDDSDAGALIRIRLPLTGNAGEHSMTAIERAVRKLKSGSNRDRRPTLVLELSPQRGEQGLGTDFTSALKLASYLRGPEMSAVKTVAYIPRTIKGHGVLIAIACDQIAMAPDAELGEATADENSTRAIDPIIVNAYKEIVDAKRTVPQAVALGMVDRRLEVVKVETDQGTEFVLGSELDELKKNHTIISQETIVPAGSLGIVSGREGRDFGLLLASDTEALARGIGVPASAVKQDQSMLGNRRPVMLHIEGPITRRMVHQMETLIGTELKNRGVNWIGITIDSSGGVLEDCQQLAKTLAGLRSDEVQTVAYIPVEASGGAALVALACDEIDMQPEAHLGGKGSLELDRQTLDAARSEIRALPADDAGRSWSLVTAMIDPDIELFTYQNTKNGDVRYFSDEEAKVQPTPEDWRRGARIKPAGETLRLDASRAKDLGVASHVVNSFDELKQIYGFDGDIRVAEPNWALELIEALSSPALGVLLIVIGFVGIYIELHSPGVGAGGFVAAVAFLLFFWSHFLDGTAEWLEVLLFLGGIFFLLMELLVLPGFGVFGLGGGAMILASLVLATQTFVFPRTESQMVELRHSLTMVAAASLIVVASSIALRRYLPSTPIFRKLLLNPPPEEELIDLAYRESLADFSHLVGEQGVATTNLMPTGKAEISGQLIDVISDGLPVDRGAAVIVVNTRGNRVQVRALEG